MRAILGIALKDLKILTRDRASFFWVLGFPILLALFFGTIFSGSGSGKGSMRIAVVDLDRSEYSRALVAELGRSEALKLEESTLDSARVLVRQGKRAAYVAIHPGAGESFGFGDEASAKLEVGIDPSRRAEKGYLRGLLTQATFAAMQTQLRDGGGAGTAVQRQLDRLDADTTLDGERRDRLRRLFTNLGGFMGTLDTVQGERDTTGEGEEFSGPALRMVDVLPPESGEPRSGYEITFPSSMLWALIGVCSSFAITLVTERRRGTFLRLKLAPISRAQILLGKGLACFLGCLGSSALLLLLGSLVFGVRISNPAALLAALGAAALCFVGLMMTISVLGRTEQAVAGAGWAILLVQSMAGGGMIPLIAMPPWLQAVSNFTAVKWGIVAIEGAIWRGFSWGEMLTPLLILVAVGAVGFTIGATVLSRTDS